MDPISALSVAGTVVQFVDFGSRLLKEGRGFYKSPSGASAINQELEIITTALQSVISKLRQSVEVMNVSRPLTELDHQRHLSYHQICDGTAAIAEEICSKLETLKMQGNKYRKWESLEKAVKSIWSRQEVDGLVDRLSVFREILNTHILSFLWYVSNLSKIGSELDYEIVRRLMHRLCIYQLFSRNWNSNRS